MSATLIVEQREYLDQRFDALASEFRALRKQLSGQPEHRERMDLPEAARYVKLARRTMYKKCMNREVPHSKVGGRLYFSQSELDSWIAAGRRKTVSEMADTAMAGNK